jgi:hypothetical protein
MKCVDDDGDPGYETLTEGEKVDVLSQENKEYSEDEAEEEIVNKPKLMRDRLDIINRYTDLSPRLEVQPYYTHICTFRGIKRRRHQHRARLKADTVLKPAPQFMYSSPQP